MVRTSITVRLLSLAALGVILSGCVGASNTGATPATTRATIVESTPVEASTTRPAEQHAGHEPAVQSEEAHGGHHPVVGEYQEEIPSVSVATVNADDFKTANPNRLEYRFISPSGNLNCGFDFYDGWDTVGCQSRDVPKPENSAVYGVGQCSNPGAIAEVTGAQHTCFPDGLFVDKDALVLEYGQTISVGNLSCTSDVTGMTCFYVSHGFAIAREAVVLF